MSDKKRDLLIIPVSAIILGGWVASVVEGIITQSYVLLTFTSPFMIALVGYVFGVNIVRRTDNNK